MVEDDAVVSPHFLRFMNEALDTFAAVERVFSVGSWNYFAPPDDLQGNFFLRYPDSLAWATWKRSRNPFQKDGTKLLTGLKEGLLDHPRRGWRSVLFLRDAKSADQRAH